MDRWEERKRPVCLEGRFEFDSYENTRDFLDRLGEKSESLNRYPDISFGRTYVNITIRPSSVEKDSKLSDEDYKFASEIDELID